MSTRLRALLGALALLAAAALAPAFAGAQTPGSNAADGTRAGERTPGSSAADGTRGPAALETPPSLNRPPAGFERTGSEVSRIAGRVAKIRAARAGKRNTYAAPYVRGPVRNRRWQVSFWEPRPGPNAEIGQVYVDDRTGRVLEAWTGYQVAWTMARGYPGAFGRKVNAPYVWIGLCVLFVLPFLRPPLRLLHLDLAVLLAFSISYAFFQDARIGVSVPLVYPLLAYLLARMLGVALARARGRSPADRPPLKLTVSYGFLAIAIVFLVGFRVGLNVTDANVIDVGYAGVIGADRVLEGERLYGTFPPDNARGDTYGPVTYYAYVPFGIVWPWSGTWDDLPGAHGAAVAFDLACILLLFLVGRRVRGPGLGILLAYAWAAYPFTLLVSNSSANDALVAALVLLGLLAIARPARRGAAVAVAGLSKFAPLALAPLAATYRGGARAGEWDERDGVGGLLRPVAVTSLAFVVVAAAVLAPVVLAGGGLDTFYARTLAFQNERGSPFSVWGLYDLPGLQNAVQLAAVGLALAVAVVPRRRDVVVVAALGAAVLVALQLGVTHWFYLYLVWFLPLVLIALLAPHREPEPFPRLL